MSTVLWFEDHEWSMVRVRGADRADFLHRLTTNVIPKQPAPLVHNFFLSVNAKVQAEFWVSAQEDFLALLTPEVHIESLRECIDRYHFGEKIEVDVPPGRLFVVQGAEVSQVEPYCEHVFATDPRYGEDCLWCFTAEDARDAFLAQLNELGSVMEPEEAERRRVILGRPKVGIDYDEESLFVEVAQRGDFSEEKGCYPGQEIVARVLHRGRLNRHLRGFVSQMEIPPTWRLRVDGKDVASVTSTVSTPEGGGMGYLLVRREYGEVGQNLTAEVAGQEYTLTVTQRAGEVITGEDE